MTILSFSLCLLAFVVIGVLSVTQRQKTSQDYLLAGGSVKPWLVALSAVATNNSGYMFLGLIGYSYAYGLQSMWLMIGWIFGDFIASLFIHKKLKEHTVKNDSLSFASVLSQWHGEHFKYLRIICALMTIIFLGIYAAAQLNAGGKALHVLFGWDYVTGAIMGAIIVVLYCFAGGIRASIWTDAAQSFVMFFAMILMFFISMNEVGGFGAFANGLSQVSPTYLDMFPKTDGYGPFIGPLLFVAGWFFAGLGVVGQPHIMVRFMAMENAEDMTRTRIYYYTWFTVFSALTIATALCARMILPETEGFDAELALPALAVQLLPDFLVGLVLAGLFAATISTADSQILSCTASITHDLLPEAKKGKGYLRNKLATMTVAAIALAIALSGNKSVFSLVLIAWSALACAFTPLLTVYAFKQRVSETVSILMVGAGVAVMILWRHYDLGGIIYEVAPGILAGFIVFFISKLFAKKDATPEFEKNITDIRS